MATIDSVVCPIKVGNQSAVVVFQYFLYHCSCSRFRNTKHNVDTVSQHPDILIRSLHINFSFICMDKRASQESGQKNIFRWRVIIPKT